MTEPAAAGNGSNGNNGSDSVCEGLPVPSDTAPHVPSVEILHPGTGDFVGRDPFIFKTNFFINHLHGDLVVDSQDIACRVHGQVERLRGRITRAAPVEQRLRYLAQLKSPKTRTRSALLLWPPSRRRVLAASQRSAWEAEIQPDDFNDRVLREIRDLEQSLPPCPVQPDPAVTARLNALVDAVNNRIAQLDFLFSAALYPALVSDSTVSAMISKIGHEDLRREAQVHLSAIEQLRKIIPEARSTTEPFDVLGEEAKVAIGAMIDIAERVLLVEELVQEDCRRRRWTVVFVLSYIGCVMLLTTLAAIHWYSQLPPVDAKLSDLRLPIIKVPWPVCFWSLIGSFASMIHRFNKTPVSNFGDAVKWLLTRPVQGLVLGGAFYLTVSSGLLLLSGAGSPAGTGSPMADDVVLVMAFLVGFSDRFGDKVFSTLVRNYADGEPASPAPATSVS